MGTAGGSGDALHVAVVHGYFLQDSGSAVYVRELSRALVALGHDVTLVCQDREPERCDFIDSVYELDEANQELTLLDQHRPRSHDGACRLVRPNLSGDLLVYIEGAFPPFEDSRVRAFQNASPQLRDRYVARNIAALSTTFARWMPDVVLAQHLIMQPYVVRAALDGRAPYMVTEHGSALNFSVRANAELVPFALEGLAGASRVAAVSEAARDDLVAWAEALGCPIGSKTETMPAGIDSGLFSVANDRTEAIAALKSCVELPDGFDIGPHDDIIAFGGSLRPTKGIQHLIAATGLMPDRPGRRLRLLIAGDGPARPALEALAALVACGDTSGAAALAASEPLLASPPEWGAIVPQEPVHRGDASTAFLGHIDHGQLARVFAAADVCVTPSVFPEAGPLVSIEAQSAGSVAVASHHGVLAALNDTMAEALTDPAFTALLPGSELTSGLAVLLGHILDTYPTNDAAFRRTMRALALDRYPSWEEAAERYVAMAREPAGCD